MNIYSLHKVNELADGDEDFVMSIITVFLEEIPEDLKGLEKAVSEKDYDQIRKLAHKIKPNVELMGMEDTRANAYALENLGRHQGDFDEINQLFPKFKKDVEQVLIELKRDFT